MLHNVAQKLSFFTLHNMFVVKRAIWIRLFIKFSIIFKKLFSCISIWNVKSKIKFQKCKLFHFNVFVIFAFQVSRDELAASTNIWLFLNWCLERLLDCPIPKKILKFRCLIALFNFSEILPVRSFYTRIWELIMIIIAIHDELPLLPSTDVIELFTRYLLKSSLDS